MIRKMVFGDNLTVMREGIGDSTVNLCCTDPPFNSGRNYNTFIAASDAQKTAFKDTWTWDESAQESREDIRTRALASDAYARLDKCLEGYDLVLQEAVTGHPASLRAYLAFMGPRIVEIHRVLRDDGSFYLHCDPSASHYLKGTLDAVFGTDCFRNELVWGYGPKGRGPKFGYHRKHDIILFYGKNPSKGVFHRPYTELTEATRKSFSKVDEDGRRYKEFHGYRAYLDESKGRPVPSYWTDIAALSGHSESLGYPTQKPRALYERIIKASSNEGDLVLDPFAGCGTTIDAAEALGRQWIGIDLTIMALDPMQERLNERYSFQTSLDYEIEGYPKTLQDAQILVNDQRKYHDFANWAVTRIGLKPTPNVGDGGVDGIMPVQIWDAQRMVDYNGRVVAEVKSGNPSVTQVRAFRTSMQNMNADIGIFIMLDRKPTRSMKEEQQAAGYIEHNNTRYPRLQYWNIDDEYFNDPSSVNRRIRVPWNINSRSKLDKHVSDSQLELQAVLR